MKRVLDFCVYPPIQQNCHTIFTTKTLNLNKASNYANQQKKNYVTLHNQQFELFNYVG